VLLSVLLELGVKESVLLELGVKESLLLAWLSSLTLLSEEELEGVVLLTCWQAPKRAAAPIMKDNALN
jgi:hypothetical protein